MKSNPSDEEHDQNIADSLDTEMIPNNEGKTASTEGDSDSASRRTPTFHKSVDYTRNCVARALYDNVAESPDELAFRRGDLLTVLEQNTAGLEGWWLCSLRGRQGICPGNRLRLLAGVYDSGRKLNGSSSWHSSTSSHPQTAQRRSWQSQSNKVVTPHKEGDFYSYDFPTSRGGSIDGDSRYDVLPPGQPQSIFDHHRNHSSRSFFDDDSHRETDTDKDQYAIPRCPPVRVSNGYDSYDIPRPLAASALSPSSSVSSLAFSSTTTDSVSSSNRSSIAPDYDVPKSRLVCRDNSLSPPMAENLFSQQQIELASYDVPPPIPAPVSSRSLSPLLFNVAIETLEKLESEVVDSVHKFLSFLGPSWREMDKSQPVFVALVLQFRKTLSKLCDFGEAIVATTSEVVDKGLVEKLRSLVKVLLHTNKIVRDTTTAAYPQECGDSDVTLPNDGYRLRRDQPYIGDPIEKLIDCTRCVIDDVKEFASFVQGNASLLFKRDSKIEKTARASTEEFSNGADYANLDATDGANAKTHPARSQSGNESQNNGFANEKQKSHQFDFYDRQLLNFYATQCAMHSLQLTRAIDTFLATVERNQPPKSFVARGKLVILNAHRLVHIGDTVYENVSCCETGTKVLHLTNALAESLATVVHKIKKAAMHFPSVTSVQEMVDSVVDVSHLARDLKVGIILSSRS